MLRGIRKASANWLGKTIMGAVVAFLIGSFAIWGINDIFRGFGMSRLAKIGSTEIGIEQFRQLYNDRLQQFSRRVGRPITPDQARALGLDRQILSTLIGETSLDERARAMRLGIPDDEIASRIRTNPIFQGPTGQFDRARFEQAIRSIGYTEPRWIADQRREALRKQIIDTVNGGVSAPKTEVEALNRYYNEQRTIDYVLLDRAAAGDVPDPAPDVLARYFEERKVLFRAPEYRQVVVLALTPPDLEKSIEVSDDDAKRAYENSRSRYVTPERRHLEQIVFQKPEEAAAASERLKQGMSLADLAAELGRKEEMDLGTVAKSGLVDQTVADPAFSLKEGETSAPIQGRFGTTIIHVVKVEPEQVRSFAEVEPEIKRTIALDRAKQEILKQHDKIEDERAAGHTLVEAAQKLNLTARTIDAIDRSGRGPDGNPVADLPRASDLLSAIYASDIGVDNEPLTADGGFIWYDVVGVTPSHERSLEEVKSQVESRWHDDEVASRLKAKASDMVGKLKAGTSLLDIAKADGLKLETAQGLKRNTPTEQLSGRAIEQVFRTAKGEAGSAQGDRPTQQIVFSVTAIIEPNLDMTSPEAKRLNDAVHAALAEDLISEYLMRIQSDIGVTINEHALSQVIGGGS
ncbi:MAG: SurA N-terminal domain-containing protein [Xanthobacteraceae bacterium]